MRPTRSFSPRTYIIPFEDMPKNIWLRFETMGEYEKVAAPLQTLINESRGKDQVVVYINETHQVKRFGPRQGVRAGSELMEKLTKLCGEENVKVTAG